ncbi:MAG: hypothetical protein GSR73_03170 [Desulfurococcales archaeon]|nr:hypothetical protein [Desulfurococcales archaeon]
MVVWRLERRLRLLALSLAVLLIVLGVALLEGPSVDKGEGVKHQYIVVGGMKREYYVYRPGEADPRVLVILLHGGGGSAERMMKTVGAGFNDYARQYGYLLAYLQAAGAAWNNGLEAVGVDVDDVGFVKAVIEVAASRYNVTHVFLVGMSSGGMMALRAACEIGYMIDGVAAVSANLPSSIAGECKLTGETGLLIIHGTMDPIVPWEGGPVRALGRERGEVLSTWDTVGFWLKANGCRNQSAPTHVIDRVDDGTRVEFYDFRCKGAPVLLYKIVGGGHPWPGAPSRLPERVVGRGCKEIDATKLVIDFINRMVGRDPEGNLRSS